MHTVVDWDAVHISRDEVEREERVEEAGKVPLRLLTTRGHNNESV
jgi:hypothetical protein